MGREVSSDRDELDSPNKRDQLTEMCSACSRAKGKNRSEPQKDAKRLEMKEKPHLES